MNSGVLKRPFRIEPRFQHYTWGDTEFIPAFFGIAATGEPFAEAWLGAHKIAPSWAQVDGGYPLDQLLPELPYLVKIISAAQPLSIQVHPSREQAAHGYHRENEASIPLNSPRRNYRDENHKPELLIALTRFSSLCGFRPRSEISADLLKAGRLGRLLPPDNGEADWVGNLVASYFAVPDEIMLPALLNWIETRPSILPSQFDQFFSEGGKPDRGIFFFLLLNLVVLNPGDAIFLDAGTPHAYLGGSGIEVMATSDNVIRAGLTTKHVDIAEFMRVVRFDRNVPLLQAHGSDTKYATPAREFVVFRTSAKHDAGFRAAVAHGPELLLFIPAHEAAAMMLRWKEGSMEFRTAGCCIVPDGISYEYSVSAGEIVRVAVP